MKKFIIIILIVSINLLSGCYSFYGIDVDKYDEIKEKETLKVLFKDNSSTIIENVVQINSSDEQIEIISEQLDNTVYKTKYVEKILVERVDFPKTILTPLFISGGVVLIYALFGGSFSPGG